MKMFSAETDSRSQDGPPLFTGVLFLLCGFDSPTHTQVSGALEQHGGVNVGEYDESCTHVIVSRTFLWDDPVCAAARKDGKCLSTEIWVSDSLDLGVIQDVNHVIYRPMRDSQGILGCKNLVVCLTGYQGQARRNVMRMVHLMGAHFSKPLIANRVTHLVCYKFEGEKFNLAKQLGLKLVNHLWLEDCLRNWALLAEEDYSRSGLEVELSEAEAKDSEDDGNLKPVAYSPKILKGADLACLERIREEVKSQMQMENGGPGNLLDQCPEEGKRTSVHLSPNLLFPKKIIATRVGEDLQKMTSEETFVCEVQAERKEADPTSPVVLGVKRRKPGVSPEVGSHSKRKSSKGNANNSDCMSREVDNQQGEERRSSEDAGNEMQVEGASLGKIGNSLELTTPAKCNGHLAEMREASKNTVSKKDENRGLSPVSGGIKCTMVACDEEDVSSKSPSVRTPHSAKVQKHGLTSGTDLNPIVAVNEGLLPHNEVEADKNLHTEVPLPEVTPNTIMSKNIITILPPVSTPSKEQENLMQLKCSSANKSTEKKKLPKTISARKAKLKVVQSISCMDGKSVNSSPGEVGVCVLSVKPSLPASSIERAGEIADVARDFAKTGEEQTTPCNNKDEHASERQVKESKVLSEKPGKVEVHPSGEVAQNAKPGRKMIDKNNKGKLKQAPHLKNSEKKDPVTVPPGETKVSDEESSAHLLPLDKGKTADNTLLEGLGKKPDTRSMACVKTPSKENTCGRQVRESKLPSRGEIGQPAKPDGNKMSAKADDKKLNGAKKEGKVSKKPDLISRKTIKSLTVEKMAVDKENAKVSQSHEGKGEPKTPQKALVVRKSQEKVVPSDTITVPQKVKAAIQRCFALSGHRQEIKPLQALVKKLGGKLCRDSHQWSHQTTHLVVAGELRRTEKLFAAAAAGKWILREDYLKDSSEAGVFLDEKKYEWQGPGMTKDASISFDAPRKWRELRENTGCCALEGLRILLYGECLIPSLDTLRRAIRAGGADLVATCPPYTKFLASKVDFAIVSPGTSKNDQWIREFLNHSMACVTTDFFVDFVCKPSSSLDRHILYDTHHLVQASLARLQASNADTKRDRKGSGDGSEECRNEEISCAACGQSDREDVMLLCGDDKGSGCGMAMHIDCCKPPLDKVPAHDWYCVQCTKPPSPLKKRKRGAASKG